MKLHVIQRKATRTIFLSFDTHILQKLTYRVLLPLIITTLFCVYIYFDGGGIGMV